MANHARRAGVMRAAAWAFCAGTLVLAPGSRAAHAAVRPPHPVAGQTVTVELDEIRVDGNTVLDARTIEQTVYPFLGPGKTAVDVDHARDALARLYRDRGYATVLVSIPPQRVTNGIVYLKVTEQPVERLRVVGAHFFEPAVVRKQAPSVKKGSIPRLIDLQRDVRRLNQLPDRTVTPSFRPGRAPDTVDVDLNVQDSLPLHGTLELNNRRSLDTTSLRLNGSLTYDNFFQRGDSGTLFFQVAPENTADARVVGGSYLFHVPGSILALLASYTNSDSDVSTVGGTDVVGKGQIASIRLQVPLGSADNFIQTLTTGIDYKKLDENVELGGAATRTPLTYYPLTIGYEGDWTGPRSQMSLSAAIVLGLRGLGSDYVEFDNKRYNGQANFAYLRVDLSRTQTLPHDIQLYGNFAAQVTPDTLVSSEQLSLGGLDTVRGYLESEALGDQGVAFQAELRSPSVATHVAHYVNDWRFHLFGDIGDVSIHQALFDPTKKMFQASSYTLSSVGVGTRVRLFGSLSATFEDAFLLSRGPSSRSGEQRFLFRVYGSF